MIVRILIYILFAVIAAQAEEPAPQQPPVTSDEMPAVESRVVLNINRNKQTAGFVAMEDDQVIVIRTREGELQSYPKSRVLEIIRLVEPLPDQHGVVVLNNGQLRDGLILEDHFDYVKLEIEGIRTKLKREVVHHVVLEPTFDEKYAAYKATLEPFMLTEQLSLCRWLVEERRYDLAKPELDDLLSKKVIEEARRLLALVEASLALKDQSQSRTGNGDVGATQSDESETKSGPVRVKDLLPQEILSNEDVNLIRVYEIDFSNPPKVHIEPDTIRTLIENYTTSELIPATQAERNAMFRADPINLTRLIFQLRAREMYSQINVLSEPHALNLFRQRVHNTWLMNNCATSRCHGGINAGRLFLHRYRAKDPRVRYTNLLILERLELDPEWPLINYQDPEMSLLIQYALPQNQARLPHPEVKGWRPVFRHHNDRLKDYALQWIRAMMQPRPDYPVEYEPPMMNQPVDVAPEEDDGRTPR